MGCSYWAWIRPPWVNKWVMRSAMPARSLANPRAGSQPVVLVFLVSQKNLLMGPGQSAGVQCNMEGPTRVAQTSPPMWKCASIFCLYIKVCSASVFTILAGRRLLPPGWCSPWDHSPVGFGLWFMWLFQRSPGFVHGGSVPTLHPSTPLAESAACVVMQGRGDRWASGESVGRLCCLCVFPYGFGFLYLSFLGWVPAGYGQPVAPVSDEGFL